MISNIRQYNGLPIFVFLFQLAGAKCTDVQETGYILKAFIEYILLKFQSRKLPPGA